MGDLYSAAQIPMLQAAFGVERRTKNPKLQDRKRFRAASNGEMWILHKSKQLCCFIIYLQVETYIIFHLRRLMWNNKEAVTRISITLEKKEFCFCLQTK